MKSKTHVQDQLRQIREGYTALLRQSESGPRKRNSTASCCGSYAPEEMARLPEAALQSSFGCGNPLKFAEVKEGQTVLDIGSGAGLDCFLAADKVGPSGRVIGLDMTPAMIEKSRRIAREKGYANVEFRLGTADQMPVEDASVDWIISNCVINLAPDKAAVFREVSRVLKSGGRVAISDIVLGRDLPPEIRESVEAYVGCIAGAIRESDYLEAMRQAGLVNVEVTSRFIYDADYLRGWLGKPLPGKTSCCGSKDNFLELADKYAEKISGNIWSAEIIARKP